MKLLLPEIDDNSNNNLLDTKRDVRKKSLRNIWFRIYESIVVDALMHSRKVQNTSFIA